MLIYRTIKPYQSKVQESKTFLKGEKIRIFYKFDKNEEKSNWIRCKNGKGLEAWIPREYILFYSDFGIMKCDYNPKELSVNKGEILSSEKSIYGFCLCKRNEKDWGWVPLNHLEPLKRFG